eukprot:749738-Hanusia_phi.AAC.1
MPLIGFIISITRNNREGASLLQVEKEAAAREGGRRREREGGGRKTGDRGERSRDERGLGKEELTEEAVCACDGKPRHRGVGHVAVGVNQRQLLDVLREQLLGPDATVQGEIRGGGGRRWKDGGDSEVTRRRQINVILLAITFFMTLCVMVRGEGVWTGGGYRG